MTITETPAEPVEVQSRPLEVVEPPKPVSAETERGNATITAVAEAALAMPGVPGRDEFMTLAMTAKMLSLSGAAPEAVRNNPYVAFHVAMVGRDLGISPSASIELIDVIPGRNGSYSLSLSPQLLNGQIRRLGLGEILKKRVDVTGCVAVAVGPAGIDRRCRLTWRNDVHAEDCNCDILGEVEFTWEDAQQANLAGDDCQPGNHSPACGKKDSVQRLRCNQGYITYWKRMSWWRSSGFCADDYFPEAGLGLYTAEELGAVVDENGRAIDPNNVELPDGYQPKAVGVGNGNTDDQRQDPEDLWRLQLRILALPGEETDDLRARWQQMAKLKGYKPYALSEAQYRLAESVLAGLEKRAKSKHGYNAQTAVLEAQETMHTHLATVFSPAWGQAAGAPNPGGGGGQPTNEVEAPESTPTGQSEDSGAGSGLATHDEEQETGTEPEGEGEGEPVGEAEVVKAMKPADVKEGLFQRGLDVTGDNDQCRKRLTLALLRERLERGKQ